MSQQFSHVEIPVGNAQNEPINTTQAREAADSTDSAEEPMSKSVKRKASARSVKKDPNSAEVLLTSSKSKLIDVPDLHGRLAGFFGNPENWATVPEAEKEFIRSILPPNVELNDDGSIPEEFWKYNNNFRGECRMLQEDLAAGRLEPEWQRQAHEAMKERAEGKFDKFKEREFEEHWGQKQKPQWNYLAGHASKVMLPELLSAGLFQVGDVWCFAHTFGRGKDMFTVAKDCTIVKIDDKSVTLAIPPHQLRYARRLDLSQPDPGEETNVEIVMMNERAHQGSLEKGNDNDFTNVDLGPGCHSMDMDLPGDGKRDNSSASGIAQQNTTGHNGIEQHDLLMEGVNDSGISTRSGRMENPTAIIAVSEPTNDIRAIDAGKEDETAAKEENHDGLVTVGMNTADNGESACPENPSMGAVIDTDVKTDGSSEATTIKDPEYYKDLPEDKQIFRHAPNFPTPTTKSTTISEYIKDNKDNLAGIAAATVFDVTLLEVTGLQALEKKILELDGRAKPGSRTASTWRDIRCHRNEQDIGSLFEIRDEYYAAKHKK